MSAPDATKQPAAEFKKIISDFVADIATVFPEHGDACAAVYNMDMAAVYEHCKRTYAPQFFNILYRNDAVLFAEPIELLPGLNFKALWETPDVSDATKEAVWKYLQLVMFSVVSDLSDTATFGDAAKLFEAIDESVLKTKLEEVMQEMQDMFKNDGTGQTSGQASAQASDQTEDQDQEKGFPLPGMDPNSMHEHLNGLLGGKIGSLAKEIAEETATELNLDTADDASVQSVFQNLFKNPGKLMGIVKSVGQKLDAKMKSGEIKESEIMQEASDLMNKMKKMPGINNVADLLKKMGSMGGMGGMEGMADIAKMAASMGLGGGGKNAKFNMGAMQSHLNQNLKSAKTKERMQQKLDQRKAEAQKAVLQVQSQNAKFSTGETVERTPRVLQGAQSSQGAQGAQSTQGAQSSATDAEAAIAKESVTTSNKKKKNKNKK
jgi:hypothetical protein